MQLIKLKSICLLSQHQNHSMLHIEKRKRKSRLEKLFVFSNKEAHFLPEKRKDKGFLPTTLYHSK